jgi:hypothetical protein
MRVLGDEYVKAEFRAHRDVENPVHLVWLSEYENNVWRGVARLGNDRANACSGILGGLLDGMAALCPED